MEDYLARIRQYPGYTDLAAILPEKICPFLFYSLVPYIFTLTHKGWFDWVESKADSYRRAIKKEEFSRKEVNGLYPNEVLVRCPNPHNNIVAGVGPWTDNRIKVRILYAEGLCPAGHKPTEEVILDKKEAGIKALAFNQVFSEFLSTPVRNRDAYPCNLDSKVAIEVSKIIHPCRYHKKKRGFEHLLPDGFCAHLFHALFPYILAKMYNAKVEETINLSCCPQKSRITVSLKKIYWVKNRFLRKVYNLPRRLFEMLFRPIDIIDYNLRIEVLNIKDRHPGCFLKERKRYTPNIRSKEFICPAAFHMLYPYLLLGLYDNKMTWGQGNPANLVSCADCVGIICSVNKK